jgi:hypothetical protein
MPRNFPTVALNESAAGLAALNPIDTCAPLTASTRPIMLRFEGAAAGADAIAAGGGLGAGDAGVGPGLCVGGVAKEGGAFCRFKVESIARFPRKVVKSQRSTLPANAGDSVKRALSYRPLIQPWGVSPYQAMSIRVRGPSRVTRRRKASARRATQPAVGANLSRAM